MIVEDKLNFPFFDCIFSVFLFLVVHPLRKFNLIIVLIGVPICIVDFYLRVSVLVVPSLFVVYVCVYLQNEYYKMTIFWIFSYLSLACLGLVVLPALF